MLTRSVTSPPVSFQPWTEAPGGSTLPSAGRDRKTHREGAFILQLHKSQVFGFRVFKWFFLAWGTTQLNRRNFYIRRVKQINN